MRIKERFEEMKAKMEKTSMERTQRPKGWSSQLNNLQKKPYLYQKIKENYEKNCVLPELEK